MRIITFLLFLVGILVGVQALAQADNNLVIDSNLAIAGKTVAAKAVERPPLGTRIRRVIHRDYMVGLYNGLLRRYPQGTTPLSQMTSQDMQTAKSLDIHPMAYRDLVNGIHAAVDSLRDFTSEEDVATWAETVSLDVLYSRLHDDFARADPLCQHMTYCLEVEKITGKDVGLEPIFVPLPIVGGRIPIFLDSLETNRTYQIVLRADQYHFDAILVAMFGDMKARVPFRPDEKVEEFVYLYTQEKQRRDQNRLEAEYSLEWSQKNLEEVLERLFPKFSEEEKQNSIYYSLNAIHKREETDPFWYVDSFTPHYIASDIDGKPIWTDDIAMGIASVLNEKLASANVSPHGTRELGGLDQNAMNVLIPKEYFLYNVGIHYNPKTNQVQALIPYGYIDEYYRLYSLDQLQRQANEIRFSVVRLSEGRVMDKILAIQKEFDLKLGYGGAEAGSKLREILATKGLNAVVAAMNQAIFFNPTAMGPALNTVSDSKFGTVSPYFFSPQDISFPASAPKPYKVVGGKIQKGATNDFMGPNKDTYGFTFTDPITGSSVGLTWSEANLLTILGERLRQEYAINGIRKPSKEGRWQIKLPLNVNFNDKDYIPVTAWFVDNEDIKGTSFGDGFQIDLSGETGTVIGLLDFNVQNLPNGIMQESDLKFLEYKVKSDILMRCPIVEKVSYEWKRDFWSHDLPKRFQVVEEKWEEVKTLDFVIYDQGLNLTYDGVFQLMLHRAKAKEIASRTSKRSRIRLDFVANFGNSQQRLDGASNSTAFNNNGTGFTTEVVPGQLKVISTNFNQKGSFGKQSTATSGKERGTKSNTQDEKVIIAILADLANDETSTRLKYDALSRLPAPLGWEEQLFQVFQLLGGSNHPMTKLAYGGIHIPCLDANQTDSRFAESVPKKEVEACQRRFRVLSELMVSFPPKKSRDIDFLRNVRNLFMSSVVERLGYEEFFNSDKSIALKQQNRWGEPESVRKALRASPGVLQQALRIAYDIGRIRLPDELAQEFVGKKVGANVWNHRDIKIAPLGTKEEPLKEIKSLQKDLGLLSLRTQGIINDVTLQVLLKAADLPEYGQELYTKGDYIWKNGYENFALLDLPTVGGRICLSKSPEELRASTPLDCEKDPKEEVEDLYMIPMDSWQSDEIAAFEAWKTLRENPKNHSGKALTKQQQKHLKTYIRCGNDFLPPKKKKRKNIHTMLDF